MKFSLYLLFFSASIAFASPASPEGTWRVIGDKSGESEALVTIVEKNGALEGKIIKVFPRKDVDPKALCELCPGERKNQPVEGLKILSGFRPDKGGYSGGEILDPDSGEVYRATLKLSADGKKLEVRGYVLIPLFGRSETWIRE